MDKLSTAWSGSGALTIAVAKCNPNGKVFGIDRWGAEYASFSKKLCEENAIVEGVSERTVFAILGGFAFTCFWGILEMHQQEQRVVKGWFPENPKRQDCYEASRKNRGL